MRKILFGITIFVLLIFTGIIMYKGLEGNLEIWGYTDISEENDDIDRLNSELKGLVETTYPQKVTTLNASSEKLQQTKKEYEDQAVLLANSKYYKQKENYKNEFILVKIGRYADENNLDIRLVVTNSSVTGLYDLNFTLIGKYADVANYIYDIENDSSMGYKIEDFIMVADSGKTELFDDGKRIKREVKANFYCKEVSIDMKWLDENETVIPGVITRGNPFVNSMTTLTGEYKNQTLDTSRQQVNTNSNQDANNTNTAGNTTSNTTNSTNNEIYNTSVKEVDNRRDTNEPSASSVIDNATGQN